MIIAVRREVYKIVKMKDGCVYKTKFLEKIWIPLDQERTAEQSNAIAKLYGGDILCSCSTSETDTIAMGNKASELLKDYYLKLGDAGAI